MSDTHDMIDLGRRKPADTPPAAASNEETEAKAGDISQEEIDRITTDLVKSLKTVYDPEIPVDIYELGLIYKVDYENGHADITMTLTAPGCPVAGEMPIWVENAARDVDGVDSAKVEMVFDPPWTPDMMSDEAKLELGFM